MRIQRATRWKHVLSAWAAGQYAYRTVARTSPGGIPVLIAAPAALLGFLAGLLLPFGRLYTLPGGRASVGIIPLRELRSYVALSVSVALTGMLVGWIVGGDVAPWVRYPAWLVLALGTVNALSALGTYRRTSHFTQPIDHYAHTFVRWKLGPGAGSSGDGEKFCRLLMDEATRAGWTLGLIANGEYSRDLYLGCGMVHDDPKADRRLVFDGRAARSAEEPSAVPRDQ